MRSWRIATVYLCDSPASSQLRLVLSCRHSLSCCRAATGVMLEGLCHNNWEEKETAATKVFQNESASQTKCVMSASDTDLISGRSKKWLIHRYSSSSSSCRERENKEGWQRWTHKVKHYSNNMFFHQSGSDSAKAY